MSDKVTWALTTGPILLLSSDILLRLGPKVVQMFSMKQIGKRDGDTTEDKALSTGRLSAHVKQSSFATNLTPDSSSRTFTEGSSDNLAAMTQPAVPTPRR